MRKDFIHKKCSYALGCNNSTYGGGFGYCPPHYSAYYQRVKRGRTTWDEIKKKTELYSELSEQDKKSLKIEKNSLRTYVPQNFVQVT